MGPRLSRNEIRMIKSMAKKETGDNLSGKDVRIVSEIVKAMGGDDGLSEAEKNLVAVVSKVATKNPDSNKVSADTETPKKNSQLQMEMKFKTDSGNFGQKEEVQT